MNAGMVSARDEDLAVPVERDLVNRPSLVELLFQLCMCDTPDDQVAFFRPDSQALLIRAHVHRHKLVTMRLYPVRKPKLAEYLLFVIPVLCGHRSRKKRE